MDQDWDDATRLAASVKQFQAEVNRFVKKVNAEIPDINRKLAFDVLRDIVLMNPVDTGRSRGNWQVAIDSTTDTQKWADEGVMRSLPDQSARKNYYVGNDRSGVLMDGATTIGKSPDYCTIWLFNNVPYILRLENGWSKTQAANGFIHVALNRVRRHMAKIGRDFEQKTRQR